MKKTFWNNNHPYTPIVNELNKLVPMSGEVENHLKNPKLERFRKASNLYHEIFNNGCMNYARGAKMYFGIDGGYLRDLCGNGLWDRIHTFTEPGMEKIVLEAAQEQGIMEKLLG